MFSGLKPESVQSPSPSPSPSRSERQPPRIEHHYPIPGNRHDDHDEKTSTSNPSSKNIGNRVECLDGLRGIACIAVFNYHFFWPWTQSIMLGHGFLASRSPEPYMNWLSLPIICLLHRGRAMVAIFFAISGYVLCRHIIRSIHDRNWDAAYRSLSSSVFRRVFRLYIPPTISMLLVALLAQMGAFRSEEAVYAGADSVHINGSVITAQVGHGCAAETLPVGGAAPGVAEFMGPSQSLHSPDHLGSAVSAVSSTGMPCVTRRSLLLSPVELYGFVKELDEAQSAQSAHANATGKGSAPYVDEAVIEKHGTPSASLQWVQYGGSWEEHPLLHDNLTYAVRDFTRTCAEWANPFHFHHYHPRYDPHTYTLPIELRGSMLIYLFLLGTLGLKTKWRISLAAAISAYSLMIGRWDMATFLGGAMLSEMDIWNHPTCLPPPVVVDSRTGADHTGTPQHQRQRQRQRQLSKTRGSKAIRWTVCVVALYLLSYPDVGGEHTPGFVTLSWFVPRYYLPLSGWMFYQSIGALLLLPCIIHSQALRGLMESPVAQYLGKISFSIYLVHGPLLHGLGFWVMPRLFERFGRTGGYVVGWAGLFTMTIYLAHWWYRKVDAWSTTVGKRVERLLSR